MIQSCFEKVENPTLNGKSKFSGRGGQGFLCEKKCDFLVVWLNTCYVNAVVVVICPNLKITRLPAYPNIGDCLGFFAIFSENLIFRFYLSLLIFVLV